MRRLLLGLILLGSVGLSANDAVAAPVVLDVVVSCQSTAGFALRYPLTAPANEQPVRQARQGFEAWMDQNNLTCAVATVTITIRPVNDQP